MYQSYKLVAGSRVFSNFMFAPTLNAYFQGFTFHANKWRMVGWTLLSEIWMESWSKDYIYTWVFIGAISNSFFYLERCDNRRGLSVISERIYDYKKHLLRIFNSVMLILEPAKEGEDVVCLEEWNLSRFLAFAGILSDYLILEILER